ncbi:DUF2927 domain-containing protein [Nioella nitratireducens]|uniref:DUF2927 domain-containing protein n=1 Tax=Nioella nitratireducens TaxID=1287720 RepID=UPI0008FD95B2|nr:DUF2927 domain-containing protein [Nioella nitratireducens]
MLTRCALILVLALSPVLAAAQEYVTVPRRLSDEAFYRLVACAAPPGGECAKPQVRWPEDRRLSLSVSISFIAPNFPGYRLDLVDQAIDRAIAEINGSGAYLVLDRSYETDADIRIYLLDTPSGGVIDGTGNLQLDGEELAAGRVALRTIHGRIEEAAIAISRDIRRREIGSVVLEEMVQALGLATDILSPAYRDSIFNERSNAVVWLRGQDAEALRRHYPRF